MLPPPITKTNTLKKCRMAFKTLMPTFTLLITLIAVTVSCRIPGADASLGSDLQVIYAINAGGYDHTDKNGIMYDADPLNVGTASDYGNNLLIIGRVPEQDEVLYRTERYHTDTFGYDLPLEGDGEYALLLKFCEVYFNEPNMKIFDVVLNRRHVIVKNLDIFAQVGRGKAHDEYVYFKVSRGKLLYKDEVSEIRNNMIRLEFIKGSYDNPKINAFVLFKGDVERIPKLTKLQSENAHSQDQLFDDDFEDKILEEEARDKINQQNKINMNEKMLDKNAEDSVPFEENFDSDGDDSMDYLMQDKRKNAKTSGPRQPNPYTSDESMVLMPVFVAIGCFIPLLFCLCKL